MAISGLAAAASYQPVSPPVSPPAGHHRHHGNFSSPITDVDAQGSSVAAAAAPNGAVGSKVDITV